MMKFFSLLLVTCCLLNAHAQSNFDKSWITGGGGQLIKFNATNIETSNEVCCL